MDPLDITELPADEVIRIGMHLHAGDLNVQASFTLGIADTDKDELAGPLGDKLLPAAHDVNAKVKLVAEDRTLAEEESKSKTLDQDREIRKAVDWRGRALNMGKIFLRRGQKGGANLSKITSPDKSFVNLRTEVDDKVALLKGLTSKAPNPDYVAKLSAEGAEISKALAAKDAAQEMDIKNLPKKTREAYLYKGLLYLAIKQIIDAGKDLDDPAGPYNMEIYRRRTAKREALDAAKAAKAAKAGKTGTE